MISPIFAFIFFILRSFWFCLSFLSLEVFLLWWVFLLRHSLLVVDVWKVYCWSERKVNILKQIDSHEFKFDFHTHIIFFFFFFFLQKIILMVNNNQHHTNDHVCQVKRKNVLISRFSLDFINLMNAKFVIYDNNEYNLVFLFFSSCFFSCQDILSFLFLIEN